MRPLRRIVAPADRSPLVLNASFDFGKFDDTQPWLFSSTGRYFQRLAGVTWLF